MVKIWEKTVELQLEESNKNQWTCTQEIAGKHKGAIWRVAWADPEFGNIIASCGNDQQVCTYKEKEAAEKTTAQKGNQSNINGRTWEQVWHMQLPDSVKDIKFAPKFFGLVLGAACSNGEVKFYTPRDIGDLGDWAENFGDIKTGTAGCNCLAWNPGFDERVMVIIGTEGQATKLDQNEQNLLQLYFLDGTEKKGHFKQYGNSSDFVGHTAPINDVAWAPLAGRSFHMIASCSADKQIIVWKMQTRNIFDQHGSIFDHPKVEKMFELRPGIPEYLRLKWNITGTVFAASADDGSVKVWQRDVSKHFQEIAHLKQK